VNRILGIAMAGLVLSVALAAVSSKQSVGEGKSQGPRSDPLNEERVVKSDEEWREILTLEQYRILRKKGTEKAFSGEHWDRHGAGSYLCAGCEQELFRSNVKFKSGTGWPSFWVPADKSGVTTLGAGCFWCTDAAIRLLDGIHEVKVGYMGGHVPHPSYEQVCAKKTGHAEVARITYDPERTSYEDILDIFWQVHDPTSLNRQGADEGPQYRSVIFYYTEAQKMAAEKSRGALQKTLAQPIVTEIVPSAEFYEAEDYHQDYYNNNSSAPYCRMVVAPKLKKIRKHLQQSGT